MNIGFITSEYPHPLSKHPGGIGTSVKNLAEALAASKHQVSVFIYRQNADHVVCEHNIKLHFIKTRKFAVGTWFWYRRYVENYIAKIIKEDNIDVIEAPDWTGISAFMRFNIPLVVRLHGSDTFFCRLENRPQKFKNYLFEKTAVRGASALVSPTRFAAELTLNIFNLRKHVEIIPNGLPLDKFENAAPDLFTDGLILYIGTLIRKKGVLELPQIFARVKAQYPAAKLLLVGNDSSDIRTNSGSTWDLFKKECPEELLKSIVWTGKVTYEEVVRHIKQAHVCVFPSFAETQGMVTIECMAMQKAVVSSNFGWSRELISDSESGFLADPGDHDEFAHKVLALLTNDSLRQEIGINARQQAVEKFDISAIAEANVRFYKTLVKP